MWWRFWWMPLQRRYRRRNSELQSVPLKKKHLCTPYALEIEDSQASIYLRNEYKAHGVHMLAELVSLAKLQFIINSQHCARLQFSPSARAYLVKEEVWFMVWKVVRHKKILRPREAVPYLFKYIGESRCRICKKRKILHTQVRVQKLWKNERFLSVL